MAIEHGVDGGAGRDLDRVRQSSHQALADLACSPVGFLAPGCDDCRLDLLRQLVGVSEGAPGPITETFQPTLLIALKDLVAGFPGNAEFPAQRSHALAVLEPDHKPHAFVHNRTFPPWHVLHRASLKAKCVTHVSGTFCYLCVGTVTFRRHGSLRLLLLRTPMRALGFRQIVLMSRT